MTQLNLSHKGTEQTKVYNYLCQNATQALVEKIEHGVRVQKDGKTLISTKTLDGFMKYAGEQARKQAAKGANYAMIDDDVVYGWAMHYFEEDSILGDLYTEDGELYKAKPASIYTPSPTPQPAKPVEKKPSLFDWLNEQEEDKEPEQEEEQETVAPLSFTQEPIEEEEQDEDQEETQVQPAVGERQDSVPVEQPKVQSKSCSSLFDIFGDDIVEG